DGIRDRNVTGVQTCALPISALEESRRAVSLDPASPEAHVALCIVLRLRKDENGALDACRRAADIAPHDPRVLSALGEALREAERSEERRVGKECRARGSMEQ